MYFVLRLFYFLLLKVWLLSTRFPYNQELERQVLEYLRDSTVVDENTLIIVEADLHTDFAYLESLGYRQLRSKEYKTNKHVFLERV